MTGSVAPLLAWGQLQKWPALVKMHLTSAQSGEQEKWSAKLA